MTLTEEQRRLLFRRGYLKIGGLVSRAQVERARREINISVGKGMNVADMPKLRVQSFCPELRRHPALMGLLLHSPVWPLAESLMGEGQIRPGSQGDAQINLRFPVEEASQLPIEPHLDGMASNTNGVPSGQLHSFTMLVGVMLNDMVGENRGNFAVWPGSHLLNAAYLREAGPRTLLEHMPLVDLPAPVQISGQAGDVVLSHYLLSHGTAPNLSCDVRYMIFFRLTHVGHDQDKWRSLKEPWLQWPGLHDLRRAGPSAR